MNLKFNDISYDEKHLMYVKFTYRGKLLRWYPKWKDVADLLSSTFATESVINYKKLTPYLCFVCLEILARENIHLVDSSLITEFNAVTDKIEEVLAKGVTSNP